MKRVGEIRLFFFVEYMVIKAGLDLLLPTMGRSERVKGVGRRKPALFLSRLSFQQDRHILTERRKFKNEKG